ncbi:MAG: UvrD-helicase domain-containing protein, partial [Clostridia bacterium]|nr:UvrD-helicase domain-containing protein [Clostridia bacterium]
MVFQPTENQKKAINEKGNILVSAAAGSGKTAVLVERVIRMLSDKEKPISADRLLIVTFTNAAAAELRARIEKRLNEECAQKPDDIGLKKQKYLISSAKICTIDSFCIDLVRNNFEKLGVSPDFKISDNQGLEALSNQVVMELISQKFEENDPVFFELLDLIGCEFDESKLAKAIRKIFDYSMVTPFPDTFLNNLLKAYEGNFDNKNIWYIKAFEIAEKTINNIKNLIKRGMEYSRSLYDIEPRYVDCFNNISQQIESLEESLNTFNWNFFYIALNTIKLPSLPVNKKINGRPEKESLKQIKENISNEIKSCSKIFYATNEEIQNQNTKLYKPVKLLINLVKEYKDNLLAAQIEDNTLTFYNAEQMTVSLLCEELDGQVKLSDDAHLYYDQYDEVLVDEYQDVNDLQDMIFYAISCKEKNLFAVGDVKQSIYGFRGANPNNFLEKKERYCPLESAKNGEAKKINLSNNFRSRKEICSYINYLFRNIMTEETGKINYNSEEKLIATADFTQINSPSIELCLVNNILNGSENKMIAEAEAIAENIHKILDSGECIHTKDGGLRKAKLSDFAILLRATSSAGPIVNTLEKQGIPVNFAAESFFDKLEVNTLLSLLQVIDNPGNDVALLMVMMSPIFGFSSEEMAQIRSNYLKGDLISAVAFAKNNNEHVNYFYNVIEEYRRIASVMPLGAFVFKLIDISGYADVVSSMKDGERRKANLFKVAELANKYQENSGGNITGFLNYINKISSDKISSAKTNTASDAVQLMSIHNSKGLQFPVCIVSNIDSEFNMVDLSQSMVFSEYNGIGFSYYDEDLKTKQNTIGKILICNDMRNKIYEEELRLLYVAMTRAEDKLILIGGYKDLKKKLIDLSSTLVNEDGYITNNVFKSADSMGDWILLTALLHPSGKALRKYADVEIIPQNDESSFDVNIVDATEINNKK